MARAGRARRSTTCALATRKRRRPTRSFSGRVLQERAPGQHNPTAGVPISLYGSNDQSSLGALLDTTTSIATNAPYSLTTSAQYLYTLVEGAAPQELLPPGRGVRHGRRGAGQGKHSLCQPAPGPHADNNFYNSSGAICNRR